MADAPAGGRRWAWIDEHLNAFAAAGIAPVIGLLHHGSGPLDTSLLHPDFAERFAAYARSVSLRYPWITRYTPINEPLTTARFSTLYGVWYPHLRHGASFFRATLNQIRATRLAMAAIRTVNPDAQLVQTEDLGMVFATPRLQYQADFENERRWLTFDLLTGRVVPGHPLHDYAAHSGVGASEIEDAAGDGCAPDIVGINHYVTSNRWLDDRLELHPPHAHGGNERDRYADVEAVRACSHAGGDRRALLLDAWERYHIPVAITEAHLGCSREQQLRWLDDAWRAARGARERGADVRAVTAWAAFGSRDWSSLVTRLAGDYEPGLFDVRSDPPRPTALADFAMRLANGESDRHPVLAGAGWWETSHGFSAARMHDVERPILIAGAGGSLGRACAQICGERGLAYRAFDRSALDAADRNAVGQALLSTNAWAVVNCAGYVHVDAAEANPVACHRANVTGAEVLAAACAEHALPLLTFSSDLVFDGRARQPYVESTAVSPLGVYGASKAEAERRVLALLPSALVVRTAALFDAHSDRHFVERTLRRLERQSFVDVADDWTTSATYLPDLINTALDLLIDGECGVWHLANAGALTWAELAGLAADRTGLDKSGLRPGPRIRIGFAAARPDFSALASERGALMPSIDDALRRYAAERSRVPTPQASPIR